MMEDVKYNFFVSSEARKQIKNKLINRGTPSGYLRLGIKGGGCSGFTYILQFEDNELNEKDLIFTIEDINIVIDKKSILYLNNSTLDWEKTLLQQGFKFNNPNAKGSCGCGTSVTF